MLEVKQPELKPCPFCGQSQVQEMIVITEEDGTQHEAMSGSPVTLRAKRSDRFAYGMKVKPFTTFWVKCGRCGAKGGIGMEQGTVTAEQAEQIAINKWNNRSS